MQMVIDPASPVPPFEQLRRRLIDAIDTGELAPGARLPTVRRLAEDLGLAPGTVARAYRELEAADVIETRGRNGTFVAPQGDAALKEAQRAASAFAAQIRALRLDPEQALALARAALRDAPSTS
ncbi:MULTISPECIES: GntR family transcriptional regulator [Microbacterium]|uniref:GntR family transcriptional regulator n=1 Tax=Microbacterium TaxID=33882 RepID=UPI0007687103|nr:MULTISPECIES: GntR family transcriptional regulator [Microbacterium]KXC06956.1 GntR family transcriptional regulator [Microbacterium hominis]QOC25762.1 GntR family transcriptional regulator [Microbacterium hominis]QYF97864.1 GntR family transcriptional regulator [Microbacterium sp. PAMC21962]